MNTLHLSESFYSIQCEGFSTGAPAYFIRLSGCNLSCGMSDTMVKCIRKEPKDFGAGDFKGDLVDMDNAGWTCDSVAVWANGKKKQSSFLWDDWADKKITDWVLQGRCHLVWTGGEPTMKQHQKSIVGFIEESIDNYRQADPFYNEIETNGTLVIEDDLFNHLDQINCSPKLANSGMAESHRINPEAIKRIMEHHNYQFKFVVDNEEDVIEYIKDYAEPFDIPFYNICMMPAMDKQEDFHEKTKMILDLGKKYGIYSLQRLHISAWNKAVGV